MIANKWISQPSYGAFIHSLQSLSYWEQKSLFNEVSKAFLANKRRCSAARFLTEAEFEETIANELPKTLLEQAHCGAFKTIQGDIHFFASVYVPEPTLTSQILTPLLDQLRHFRGCFIVTNTNAIPDELYTQRGLHFIKHEHFTALKQSEWLVLNHWITDKTNDPTNQSRPFDYQSDAVDRIVSTFKEGQSRATIVMPCGSGKSRIPVWVSEAMAFQSVAIVVPSLALLNQFIREWILTSCRPSRYLAICSANDVNQLDLDDSNLVDEAMNIPVTTNKKEIKRFLLDNEKQSQTIFVTYQSLALFARCVVATNPIDFVVFDEAHKTAGTEKAFAAGLNDRVLPCIKRLFMTATPKHTELENKNEDDNDDEDSLANYDMNDNTFYGEQVYKMSFSEAIKKNIICDYRIVVSVITNEELNREQLFSGSVNTPEAQGNAERIAKRLALAKAIQKYKINKLFTYHNSIADAKAFTDELRNDIGEDPLGFELLHVNGEQSVCERKDKLTRFRKSHKALLSNARCLIEGVDLPSVDMVAFMEPKRGEIDIVQAAGRAMRRYPGKRLGYIFLPLFVQEKQAERLEDAVARVDFDGICQVIHRLAENDDIFSLQLKRASKSTNENNLLDGSTSTINRVEIIGKEVALETLRRCVSA